jgi:hypothetical protein
MMSAGGVDDVEVALPEHWWPPGSALSPVSGGPSVSVQGVPVAVAIRAMTSVQVRSTGCSEGAEEGGGEGTGAREGAGAAEGELVQPPARKIMANKGAVLRTVSLMRSS